MTLDLTTPAILFPTISLLILAYTNRFIAIGNRLRNLHEKYTTTQKTEDILIQISIFKKRIRLIRDLQLVGIASLFLCVLTMFLIFENYNKAAQYVFIASLLALMTAFAMAAFEIVISTKALNIQLKGIEKELDGDLW